MSAKSLKSMYNMLPHLLIQWSKIKFSYTNSLDNKYPTILCIQPLCRSMCLHCYRLQTNLFVVWSCRLVLLSPSAPLLLLQISKWQRGMGENKTCVSMPCQVISMHMSYLHKTVFFFGSCFIFYFRSIKATNMAA